ncbi:MAG: stress response translation initiation inhibitor YciH [candidate division NC10 bacterium]|nr:stress response translation initiation inhibitor YciH [candidate division NC10 bacterium]MBI2560900.1 stress response translation initiation inhibitor YciH [candidate division NC10 bacterium]
MKNSRLVYSTDGGRVRSSDDRPSSMGQAGRKSTPKLPQDGVVRIMRERAGRGGKLVTVIHGLPGGAAALASMAADLRRLCGAGGTLKDRVIEIQGDHRERAAERLRLLGHTVKLAGG